jgi:hypothetical protein
MFSWVVELTQLHISGFKPMLNKEILQGFHLLIK